MRVTLQRTSMKNRVGVTELDACCLRSVFASEASNITFPLPVKYWTGGYMTSPQKTHKQKRLIIGPSEVRATSGANLGRPLSSSLLLLLLATVVQNPRRGCRRVSNFCMGS